MELGAARATAEKEAEQQECRKIIFVWIESLVLVLLCSSRPMVRLSTSCYARGCLVSGQVIWQDGAIFPVRTILSPSPFPGYALGHLLGRHSRSRYPLLILLVLGVEEPHQDGLDASLKRDTLHRGSVHEPAEGVRDGDKSEHPGDRPDNLRKDIKVRSKEI